MSVAADEAKGMWEADDAEGERRSMDSSTGSRYASEMRAVAAVICHYVTSSTALMWLEALGSRRVTLVYRVEAQKTRLTVWRGLAPLADRDHRGPGSAVVQQAHLALDKSAYGGNLLAMRY